MHEHLGVGPVALEDHEFTCRQEFLAPLNGSAHTALLKLQEGVPDAH